MRDGRSLKTAAALLLAALLVYFSCVSCATASPPAKAAFEHTGMGFFAPFAMTMITADYLTGGKQTEGGGKSSPWAWTALPVAVPLGLVGGAVGLAIDVVLLPNTLCGIYTYAMRPPLGYCIQQKDNAMLLKRLEGGADPNATYDDRHEWYPIPLKVAIESRNLEAFEILLAHGAAIQKALWNDGFGHGFQADYYHVELLPFYKRLLEAFPDYPFNEGSTSLIQRYCERHYVTRPSEAPVVDEMLEVMLERGLDPNFVYDARSYPLKATALDCLLFQTGGMAPERRERLVALLRRHGALRLPEIWQKDPEKPSLSIEGIAYDPAFAPVVEMLKYTSWPPQFYRFSTEYPGVEGPVLVVDFGRRKEPDGKGEIVFRQTLEEARNGEDGYRPSINEGVTIDMAFEVPVRMRMVLTLPGRRMPSRLEGFPHNAKFIYKAAMREEWLTFPTCEIYVEHAKTIHNWWQPPELGLVLWHGENYARQKDKANLHHVLDVFMHLDRIPPPGAGKE